MCLLTLAGFLCCEEVLKLKCAELKFNAEGLVLNITSRKTEKCCCIDGMKYFAYW